MRIRHKKISVTGIVLAGGQSRRMGTPKALLDFGNQKLVERIVDTVSLFTDRIILVSQNRIMFEFLEPKCFVTEDIRKGLGPLSGLYTGLTYAETDWSFVTGCDTPFLNIKLIDYMSEFFQKNISVIVPRTARRYHPLYAFYHRSILPIIEEQIKQKELAMHRVLSKVSFKEIDINGIKDKGFSELSFFNINTLQDYKKAIAILEQGSILSEK